MNIHTYSDSRLLYLEAASFIAKKIFSNPKINLGLAAGNTPTKLYENLIQLYQKKQISFSSIKTFNLDEFKGLDATSPSSFAFYMYDTFLKHIDIKKSSIHNLVAADVEDHCNKYEFLIKQVGGIDLQVLGLGTNGHIAFNEPGSLIDSITREVALTAASIQANQYRFQGSVPKHAFTMGIKTILSSKTIVLLALGESKSLAVKELVAGKQDGAWPCTHLQKHPDLHCFLDAEAAALL